jgi:predicted lipase
MNFNRKQALDCAKAIEALYRGDIGPTIICTATDTQVRVEKISAGRYIVLFPGSASTQDWLTNARVRKIKWGEGKVHGGFARAFKSVADSVADAIPPASRVIIAGHSLGGALATLCAEAFQDVWSIEAVYTFGAPRVGNGPFTRRYNQALGEVTARVVNAHDPVPHVPWVFGTYRHSHTQVYLREDYTVQFDEPQAVALAELMDTIEAASTKNAAAALGVAISHNIRSYVSKLSALI